MLSFANNDIRQSDNNAALQSVRSPTRLKSAAIPFRAGGRCEEFARKTGRSEIDMEAEHLNQSVRGDEQVCLKIPKTTFTGVIILYVECGLSILGQIPGVRGMPLLLLVGVFGWFILLLALARLVHKGKNWARVVITCVVGVMSIFSFAHFCVVLVFFGPPIVLLWLPQSNAWFKSIKKAR